MSLMITKERMIEELTKYRNPNMGVEEATKVVEELSQRTAFWMEIEKQFHDETTRIAMELKK